MSGIVFGAVAPHGFPLIPDLSADAEGALATRAALEELGRRCAAARPDVLVVASPQCAGAHAHARRAVELRGTDVLRNVGCIVYG